MTDRLPSRHAPTTSAWSRQPRKVDAGTATTAGSAPPAPSSASTTPARSNPSQTPPGLARRPTCRPSTTSKSTPGPRGTSTSSSTVAARSPLMLPG